MKVRLRGSSGSDVPSGRMIGGPSDQPEPIVVGVDVGGTFTDAVVLGAGQVRTAKVPTTPDDQSRGVLAAVTAALAEAGCDPGSVTGFTHGMTVGTNALLEGRGARTTLVATEGFTDVLELRRQDRAHLYRLSDRHPPPLVGRGERVGVRERVSAEGVLTPLEADEIDRVVEAVAQHDPESVAVGLLFSFAHPEHERQLADALRSRLPGVHVTASAELMPEIREYERISTAAVDAYLTPVVGRYLGRLGEACDAAGLSRPDIMLSNGGVLPIDTASEHAALTVLSGPAGGVIGAAALAGPTGERTVLTFDMGGTSTDVALVRDGAPGRAPGSTIAGHPVHLPVLDIETVSAGGGSIAWADSGGALRVGPTSAGARPGPAGYARGGRDATVTDANIVLGRIDVSDPLSGEVALDADAAEAAVRRLADALGLDVPTCADGIIAVAVQEMVAALRTVSVERGVDPRGATLVAFGGAGPLHACAVADELGCPRVLVPPAAGMLAAAGLAAAPIRRDLVQTVLLDVRASEELGRVRQDLRARAEQAVPGGRIGEEADCRYLGQSFTLTVPWADGDTAGLLARFEELYARRYGSADPGRTVEVVSLRVHVERDRTVPALTGPPGVTARGPAGRRIDGASLWIGDGWSASPAENGGTLLEREV